MSFFSIQTNAIWMTIRYNDRSVLWLSFLKVVVLPLVIYILFRTYYPTYASAPLLLTGISTGVVAPFISSIVGANGPMVLVTVVLTSLMVPFTLPLLAKILIEQTIHIPLLSMIRMLSLVIFVLVLAVQILSHWAPRILQFISNNQSIISFVILAIVNLEILSKYSGLFYKKPLVILEA